MAEHQQPAEEQQIPAPVHQNLLPEQLPCPRDTRAKHHPKRSTTQIPTQSPRAKGSHFIYTTLKEVGHQVIHH